MKKTIYLILSLLFFYSSCVNKNDSINPQSSSSIRLRDTGSDDYRTVKSGDFSDSSVWEKHVSGVWIDAHNVPGEGNNIFIQSNNTLTLDSNFSCKDLNLNATADIQRLDTDSDTLTVHGKLRTYTGTAPGTSTITAGITDWISGVIVFKGSSNQTIIFNGEYSADANNKGFDIIVDYPGAIATIDQDARCGNAVIKNGTLKVNPSKSFRMAGNGATIDGSMTVKNGATLIAGLIYKSGSSPVQYFTLESGAVLEFNNTSSPILSAQNLILNGTVVLSGTTANFPTGGGRAGAATINTFNNLTVKDSGAKKLANNVSVTGIYSLVSPATINYNGFVLTNP